MDQDPSTRAKIIKLLEENTWEELYDIGFDNDSLDMTPKAQATNVKINWTTSKLKTSMRQKTQLTR